MKGNAIGLDITGNIVTLDDRSNEYLGEHRASTRSSIRSSRLDSHESSHENELPTPKRSSVIGRNRVSTLVAPTDKGVSGSEGQSSTDRRVSMVSLISNNSDDPHKRISAQHRTSRSEQDGLKLRRKSLQVSNLSKMSNEVHGLTTHVNYRTEVQALKYAQSNEKCSCCKSFLTTFNIYL